MKYASEGGAHAGNGQQRARITVIAAPAVTFLLIALLSACGNGVPANGADTVRTVSTGIGYCPDQSDVADWRYDEAACENGTSDYCPDDDHVTDPRYDDDQCEDDVDTGTRTTTIRAGSGSTGSTSGTSTGGGFRGGGPGSGK
ncbi:hypothetical protein [Nocardiopsis sp. LOL_012]|uniref:hypothetical protein n=1 Tax=Nocardiopsis sp. LOL_012 TaxID=3345409 RepID=UPI003A8A90DB